MRLSYPYFMAFRLVLATFIQLWNLQCSSSIQLTSSVHFVTLLLSGDSGHISTSAIDLRVCFAPVLRTISALTMKWLLIGCSQTAPGSSVWSWKTSFFLIFVLHTCTFRSALQNLNLLSSMLPDKPIAALIHLSLLISVIRISSSLLL